MKKPKSYFKVKPNLEDYNKTYKNFNYKKHYKEIEWIKKNKLNAAYNAITKHTLTEKKNKVALYWEGPNGEKKEFSFLEMDLLSNKFANLLKKYKVKKRDRIFLFLPRVPELYIAFIGILKTGAIAGTLFSAFQSKALEDRLKDSGAKIVVTTKELKKRIYQVKRNLPELKHIIVVDDKKRSKQEIDYQKEMETISQEFKIEETGPEDLAFMLYTSGTTGKPKGVIHSHLACLHEHMTSKYVLDIRDNDVYWCTADPGWVTGIAYEILGSWSVGASSLVYAGRFSPEKWYSLIQKYQVTVWYTAPTAVRMLMRYGDKLVKKYNLKSLRHLCSVGEPLNPESVKWSIKVFKRPFHDNYWQTETGGIVIANYPLMPIKPGSMGKPVPGIKAAIINDNGKELPANKQGTLAIKPGWPSMMCDIWKNKKKYNSYFKKGWYITGDKAFKDKDGYFWFIGRDDDVIKTSGERVGPFEVESALVEHPAIIEAGVIGKPDKLRGEIIKAFITLKPGYRPSAALEKNIQKFVKKRLAGHAYPREVEFRKNLPKTRSGKIMRRILKSQELGQKVGDTSTLEKF
ncbi:acetate--CoA ligase [Candidatus Woesearchaeota archaeon]|nr:acetate--CoA ligase [Candidatus Woesearchaeota archaeon]